jgi:hypothetical protein
MPKSNQTKRGWMWFIVLCLPITSLWIGAGCASMSSSSTPDTLDNASTNAWTVTVAFASGKPQTFVQPPESAHDFGTGVAASPALITSITAVSNGPHPLTSTLSSRDIRRLRQSAPGGLMLVIYDNGIAALSPTIKKAIVGYLTQTSYNRSDYFRLLRLEEQAALMWTQNAVGPK